VSDSPKKPLKFISSVKMRISSESEIEIKNMKKLKDLTKSPVVVYDVSGKRSEKKISYVKYKKISKNEFSLFLKADGGLPIKRFVNGNNVSPGVSSIIDNSCKCLEFDFLDIQV
jgi:tRNA pseudouridine synthase 10